MSSNETAWNRHARRYFLPEALPLDTVDYCGSNFPTDSDLHLIGDPTGLRVLELGSGSCNCGIALARRGAEVTCLDLSEEQLVLGRQCAGQVGVKISFVKGDMSDLRPFPDNSFDLVLSVCAIMYVPNARSLFKEVARVLKPGSRMIFSVDHPLMQTIGATDLWPEEGADPRYDYCGPVVWKWSQEDDFFFTTYRRPVSEYVNELANAGLYVYRMHELYPQQTTEWDEPEASIRSRFPSILVMAARKQGTRSDRSVIS